MGSFLFFPASSPTGTSFSSLPPSSRYLLSGATSSETFREQELSRFYPSNKLRHLKALSDPYVSMPSVAISTSPVETHSNFSNERLSPEPFDPWCMSVKVALENAICSGWLYKHDPPSFAFQRSWKRRFVVLVDRIVYIFKSDKATNPAREHFLLTDDTLVFVSEEFKRGFVLELRKPLCKWFLRCESAAEMKFWLEAMKKIVACSKLGHQGTLTASSLATLKLTDDFRLLTVASPTPQPYNFLTNNNNKRPASTIHGVSNQRVTSRAEHRSTILRASSPSVSRTEQTAKNKLPWMDFSSELVDRRGSMPPSSQWQSTKTVIDKRRSLAQIPGWEHALPPQMPPPRSCPPSVPTATDDAQRPSLETVHEDSF